MRVQSPQESLRVEVGIAFAAVFETHERFDVLCLHALEDLGHLEPLGPSSRPAGPAPEHVAETVARLVPVPTQLGPLDRPLNRDPDIRPVAVDGYMLQVAVSASPLLSRRLLPGCRLWLRTVRRRAVRPWPSSPTRSRCPAYVPFTPAASVMNGWLLLCRVFPVANRGRRCLSAFVAALFWIGCVTDPGRAALPRTLVEARAQPAPPCIGWPAGADPGRVGRDPQARSRRPGRGTATARCGSRTRGSRRPEV